MRVTARNSFVGDKPMIFIKLCPAASIFRHRCNVKIYSSNVRAVLVTDA